MTRGAKALATVVSALAGGVLAFPGAVMWYFEWHATPEQASPPGLWGIIALGAVGGVAWFWSYRHRAGIGLRVVATMLILGSYVALAFFAAVTYVTGS